MKITSNFLIYITILIIHSISASQFNETAYDTTHESLSTCNKKGIYNVDTGECKCIHGYVTLPKDSKKQCNYELRSTSVAQLISLLFGVIGADMFYLGYIMRGIFKCIFPLGVFLVVLKVQNYKVVEQYHLSYYIIFIPIIFTILFWAIDLITISAGLINDSNGMPLQS